MQDAQDRWPGRVNMQPSEREFATVSLMKTVESRFDTFDLIVVLTISKHIFYGILAFGE